jgi:hypothetical protein
MSRCEHTVSDSPAVEVYKIIVTDELKIIILVECVKPAILNRILNRLFKSCSDFFYYV